MLAWFVPGCSRRSLRGGTEDGERGYYFDLREEGFAIYTYPTADNLGQSGTPESDAWYFIRFRAVGPEIKLKYWEESDPEPDEWTLTADHTAIVTGWVGVGSFEADPALWDFFSVATGGASAPWPAALAG